MFFDKLFSSVIFYKGKSFHLITYGLYYGIAGFLYFEFLLTGLSLTGQIFSMKTALILTCFISIGVIVFSKLLYWVYNIKRLYKNPFSVINETGFVFFGGLFGILIVLIFIPFEGINQLAMLDFAFLGLPIAQIFLRLGCASYGCCYGHPYNGPFAYSHKDIHSKSYRIIGNQPVHPTQFYSLLKNIFLFITLTAIFIRFPYQGLPIAFWMLLYPLMRFFVDFTRDYTSKNIPYFCGLRISQILCILIFMMGIMCLFVVTTNSSYQFNFTFMQCLYQSLKYIPYAAFAGIIFTVCFGYQGPKLGYYVSPD